jgi:2-amino-4-hydroxy-6-hydroxymethyldihydropteridine diphosphokinase
MYQVYLLLGSNQGDREAQLRASIHALKQHAGNVTLQSHVYETEAWGLEGLPPHYNQALLLQTELAPSALLLVIQDIESMMGRVREERWGIRPIDIDIIYVNDLVLDLPDLKVPHPLLQERRFVLDPLAEIAPDFTHPVLYKTNKTLLTDCKDPLRVVKIV